MAIWLRLEFYIISAIIGDVLVSASDSTIIKSVTVKAAFDPMNN